MVSNIEDALEALRTLHPDLVIVDYDDDRVNREEFLARFVEGEGRLRVVLLSLKEGGDEAIVYDRRTMAASQIEDWLRVWSESEESESIFSVEPEIIDEVRFAPRRRNSMKHFIVAGILIVLLMIGSYFLLDYLFTNGYLLPEQASQQAESIDALFQLDFVAIGVLFSLIVGLMVYSFIFFRRRKGDESDGAYVEGNTGLEVIWTVIPLGFVLFLAYFGSAILGRVEAADPQPLRIDVFASQWSWRFEYPESGIISTELLLPVNKQALLTVSSSDVIHSFYVPEFRLKQDVLPGEGFERELRVTPSETGEYKIRCAELCGRNHYDMLAPVTVISQDEFNQWVEAQTAPMPDDPVERGQIFAQQFGCLACHSVDGSELVGPTWKGIFGNEVQFEDGSSAIVDHDYIVNSVRNPGDQVVAGFQNLMPEAIAASMNDDQLEDVIAYIESLK